MALRGYDPYQDKNSEQYKSARERFMKEESERDPSGLEERTEEEMNIAWWSFVKREKSNIEYEYAKNAKKRAEEREAQRMNSMGYATCSTQTDTQTQPPNLADNTKNGGKVKMTQDKKIFTDAEDKNLSAPDQLVNYVEENSIIFESQDGEPFVIVPFINDQKRVLLVGSNEFHKWLRFIYREQTGKTLTNDQLRRVSDTIDMLASTSSIIKQVSTRMNYHDDTIYYDLRNSGSEVVKITKDGINIINNSNCDLAFVSTPNMKEQVTPDLSAKASDLVTLVSDLFRVTESDRLLFIVYLVSCFLPHIAHPIIIVHGEKGSSKSTALKMLSDIISPSKKSLIPMPNINDLPVTLSNGYFIAFDNLRPISPAISDILCMAVTGGSISKRKLYTDNQEIVINIQRIVGMDGINIVTNQPDLLDRSILIHMDRIPDGERKTDLELNDLFQESIGKLLGACFCTASKAMALYPVVNLTKLPRMASFAKYGYCIGESIEAGLGIRFLQDYQENSKKASIESIQNNPFIDCVTLLMGTTDHWSSSVSELYLALQDIAQSQGINISDKQFPKAPNYMSRRLNEYKSDLEKVGISFTITHAGPHKNIEMFNENPNPNVSSVPSVSSQKM